MKPNSRLATYSCARVVRDNLKNAGFQIFDGPKLWRRGPSTIAVKK
jgi:tRNA U34 5-methylaminomethyl-2-thiouridine-forming methyltransferase MnmC